MGLWYSVLKAEGLRKEHSTELIGVWNESFYREQTESFAFPFFPLAHARIFPSKTFFSCHGAALPFHLLMLRWERKFYAVSHRKACLTSATVGPSFCLNPLFSSGFILAKSFDIGIGRAVCFSISPVLTHIDWASIPCQVRLDVDQLWTKQIQFLGGYNLEIHIIYIFILYTIYYNLEIADDGYLTSDFPYLLLSYRAVWFFIV